MVVGVVVLALLVREATQAEPREILDREVALVDDEREPIVVGRRRDLAHRLGGAFELAAARADHAAQVERRRVHPRLLRDRDELALGVGVLALVVGRAPAQVGALAGGRRRDRVGLLDALEPTEDARVIAGLERDVDRAAVRRSPVGRGRAAVLDGLDRVERRAVRARPRERDREIVLGVLILDEVGERGVARRLHDAVERHRGGDERAVMQEVLGELELLLERAEVAALDVDQLHVLERGDVLRQRVVGRGPGVGLGVGLGAGLGPLGVHEPRTRERQRREDRESHFLSLGTATALTDVSMPRP